MGRGSRAPASHADPDDPVLRGLHERIRVAFGRCAGVISPPLGTLTLLLTDIEGSTTLWEQHSDGMRTAMRRHHEIAFDAIERQGGYRPPDQGEGDSLFAVFADASAAVECAVGLQRAWPEPWPEDTELRVRMALHTGTLELRDGRNYVGPPSTAAPA